VRRLLLALSVLLAALIFLYFAVNGLRITRFEMDLFTFLAAVALILSVIFRTRNSGFTALNAILVVGFFVLIFTSLGRTIFALGPLWTIAFIACLIIAAIAAQWHRQRHLPLPPREHPVSRVRQDGKRSYRG
jgi:hypothetical protein